MDKRQELLEKEAKRLESQIKDHNQIVGDTQRHLAGLVKKQQQIKNQLDSLQVKPKVLVVSDHAVLRYAERHYQFPFEKIKAEMEEILRGAENLGSVKYKGFVVRGQTVVTYTPTAEDNQNEPAHVSDR